MEHPKALHCSMRIPILTYDSMRILDNSYAQNDLYALASDLQQITESGFNVIPLSAVIDAWLDNRGHELSGKFVALACEHGSDFDYRDLPHPSCGRQRSILNILRDFTARNPGKQQRLNITSFVVVSPEARAALDATCMIGKGWWTDSWWRAATQAGLIHIGNNSWDHHHDSLPDSFSHGIPRGRFSNINSRELADYEIKQAAMFLQRNAPNPGVQLFAYPYGETNAYLTQEYFPTYCRELGIRAAFTAQSGFLEPGSGRWEVPRFLCGRDWRSPGELRTILEAAADSGRPWVSVQRQSTARHESQTGNSNNGTNPDQNPWTDSTTDEGFRGRFETVPQVVSDWVGRYRTLAGMDILDFGCGEGISALAMALKHKPRRVVGIDIMPDPDNCLPIARRRLGISQLPENLSLHRIKPGFLHRDDDQFDLVYSWSVFEHVDQRLLDRSLKLIQSSLRPGGFFFVQIAPLYYSAEGSHLFHKIPEPWCHLTTQHSALHERLVSAVPDTAELQSLWSAYRTLNKLTASELIDRIDKAGFEILRTWTEKEKRQSPANLRAVFAEDALTTCQVVILAKRQPAKEPRSSG
jgi:2-polyprenyl-3-methyl-5-hydroxy-6-metoxy-1,4-benzoquinol methylase